MTPLHASNPEDLIKVGNRCFVVLMDQRYLATVLKVEDDTLRLTFPVRDFPVEGMTVLLEFHDDLGVTTYVGEVIDPPKQPGDGLKLKLAPGGQKSRHRSFWRVPVELKGQMKDQVHPRRHAITILDLSAGGLLARVEGAATVGDVVDVNVGLPGIESEPLTCKVAHIPAADDGDAGQGLFGCAFIAPDPMVIRVISDYIRKRLRETNPEDFHRGQSN